jgi:lipoyl(octanoyl) transferase
MNPKNNKNTKSVTTLDIRIIGLTKYIDALNLQKELHKQRLNNDVPNTIILTEHYPVITFGARAGNNKLVSEPQQLEKQNIDLVETRRGGGITAHNPGQIVIYPIIELASLNLSINQYVRTLEQIGIELLAKLNVKAERNTGFPGLWIKNEYVTENQNNKVTKKIASIGVRAAKLVTTHGIAVNISNDLTIFDNIVPCGIENISITSVLKETGKKHSIESLPKLLIPILRKHLK